MHDETNQIYPSFFLGVIQSVNTVSHTVDILPYGMVEALKDVPIMTDPSNITLPEEDDIAIVIFDNRLRPMVIGFYQKFIRDGSDPSVGQFYSMQPGDIIINSTSDIGGRLMMLQTGVIKLVSARQGQGIEIDPSSGTFIIRSSSVKDITHGVVERSGWIRRKNVVNLFDILSVLDLDSLESVIQKIGTTSAPGAIVYDTPGGIEMYEKKLEIKVPGSQTKDNPQGVNLIEETTGTGVIANDPSGLTYTETFSSQSGLPLRKKTVYYDPTGVTELLTEEIDCEGNLHLFIASTASAGIQVDALVQTIVNLLNLTVTATGDINLNGALINLNGGADNVVLATMLSTFFNLHTHPTAAVGPPSVPTVPMTPVAVSSLTVKAT
jgi:hypothetical protein